MRKIIVSMFVTLDGIMEAPNKWSFQFGSKEQEKYKFDELVNSDTLLLGRVTYEGFAAAWPNMTEIAGKYADMMNGYTKIVVSTTLEEVEWNNSKLIKKNIPEEISKLKQLTGKDILVFGSSELIHTLMEHNLIDEYRLMVFPVVVGSGKHLFKEGIDMKTLTLADVKTFSSGVVTLTYKTVR
jgi:dihydrofolate reductase